MQRLNHTLPLKGLCLTAGVLLGLTLLPSNALAVTLTQWNFNSPTSDSNTSTGTVNPNIGSGTATLVGGTTATFASGDASGGSTDPATGDDSGWNTSVYPAQGSGNKTAGVEFKVSTLGQQNVSVTWDQRFSNTSSKFVQFQYSTDGTTFTDSGSLNPPTAGDTWVNNNSVDLSSIAGVNNNPNFAFRIVSAFDPANLTTYTAASPTGTYGTTGTWRFDTVTVNATPVPEPFTVLSSLAAIGIGTAMKRKYVSARQVK